MTTFLSDWRNWAYAALLLGVVHHVVWRIRVWRGGVLDYGYNRVEKVQDRRRFRFWFIADSVIFAFAVLGTANWIVSK